MADRKISEMTLLAQGDLVSTTDYLPIVDPSEGVAANRNKRILGSSLVLGALSQATNVPVGGTLSETVGGVVYPVASQFDVGTAPNQIPLNQYLGTMAWQDAAAVNVGLMQATSANVLGSVLASVENVYVAADAGNPRLALVKKAGSVPFIAAGAATPIIFAFSNANNIASVSTEVFTERMRLDASGNLGLGVVPSGWSGVGPGILELRGNAYLYSTTGVLSTGANAFFNGTNWVYQTTAAASRYEQVNGAHLWQSAPSGTAGTAITFTNAMTLDASGNLGLRTTTFGTSAVGVLGIGSGTEPTTGPADTIQLFSVDRSAGNTIPGIRCEGTGVTDAGITNTAVTNKIAIKVNGTIYYLLATTNAT